MEEFLADVRSQSDVVRGVLASYRGPLEAQLGAAARIVGRRDGGSVVLAIGMGSSLAAARALTFILPSRPMVLAEDAGEVLHYGLEAAAAATAVVAISQSGRSIETVRAVAEIRRRTATPVVVVTNDPTSPLAELGHVVLPMLAGQEIAVSTKTYVASLVVLLLFAERLRPGIIREADVDLAADWMAHAVDEDASALLATELSERRGLFILGRGPSLSAAEYAALIIKEMAALPAEAMSGGAFRHGPLEVTLSDVGVVILAPAGRTADLGARLAVEIAERGRAVWLLTDPERARTLRAPSSLRLASVPPVPEALAPLATVVPLQLLAAHLAEARGRRAGAMVLVSKTTEHE
jgi:glucosamine--fructose-6-phosphate aminotransferase (isomerizing)